MDFLSHVFIAWVYIVLIIWYRYKTNAPLGKNDWLPMAGLTFSITAAIHYHYNVGDSPLMVKGFIWLFVYFGMVLVLLRGEIGPYDKDNSK
jgi:hypothetical protein